MSLDYFGKNVLVVGDGDLSFASSLSLHVDDPVRLTASVYEKEDQFIERYGDTTEYAGVVNMQTLRMYGCNLLFGVDATNLQNGPAREVPEESLACDEKTMEKNNDEKTMEKNNDENGIKDKNDSKKDGIKDINNATSIAELKNCGGNTNKSKSGIPGVLQKPDTYESLDRKKWDIIIWNFPYPIEWNKHTVTRLSTELIWKFLRSAAMVIKASGEIRISLIGKQFYTWHVEDAMRNAGLGLEKSERFRKDDFSYYRNRFGDEREQTRGRACYIDTGNPHYFIIRKKFYLDKLRNDELIAQQRMLREIQEQRIIEQKHYEECRKQEEAKRIQEEAKRIQDLELLKAKEAKEAKEANKVMMEEKIKIEKEKKSRQEAAIIEHMERIENQRKIMEEKAQKEKELREKVEKLKKELAEDTSIPDDNTTNGYHTNGLLPDDNVEENAEAEAGASMTSYVHQNKLSSDDSSNFSKEMIAEAEEKKRGLLELFARMQQIKTGKQLEKRQLLGIKSQLDRLKPDQLIKLYANRTSKLSLETESLKKSKQGNSKQGNSSPKNTTKIIPVTTTIIPVTTTIIPVTTTSVTTGGGAVTVTGGGALTSVTTTSVPVKAGPVKAPDMSISKACTSSVAPDMSISKACTNVKASSTVVIASSGGNTTKTNEDSTKIPNVALSKAVVGSGVVGGKISNNIVGGKPISNNISNHGLKKASGIPPGAVPAMQLSSATTTTNRLGPGKIVNPLTNSAVMITHEVISNEEKIKPLPGGSGTVRTLPGGSGTIRTLPGGSGTIRTLPGGSGAVRTLPGGENIQNQQTNKPNQQTNKPSTLVKMSTKNTNTNANTSSVMANKTLMANKTSSSGTVLMNKNLSGNAIMNKIMASGGLKNVIKNDEKNMIKKNDGWQPPLKVINNNGKPFTLKEYRQKKPNATAQHIRKGKDGLYYDGEGYQIYIPNTTNTKCDTPKNGELPPVLDNSKAVGGKITNPIPVVTGEKRNYNALNASPSKQEDAKKRRLDAQAKVREMLQQRAQQTGGASSSTVQNSLQSASVQGNNIQVNNQVLTQSPSSLNLNLMQKASQSFGAQNQNQTLEQRRRAEADAKEALRNRHPTQAQTQLEQQLQRQKAIKLLGGNNDSKIMGSGNNDSKIMGIQNPRFPLPLGPGAARGGNQRQPSPSQRQVSQINNIGNNIGVTTRMQQVNPMIGNPMIGKPNSGGMMQKTNLKGESSNDTNQFRQFQRNPSTGISTNPSISGYNPMTAGFNANAQQQTHQQNQQHPRKTQPSPQKNNKPTTFNPSVGGWANFR